MKNPAIQRVHDFHLLHCGRACGAEEDWRLKEVRRETTEGDGESASSRDERPTSPNSASLATLHLSRLTLALIQHRG